MQSVSMNLLIALKHYRSSQQIRHTTLEQRWRRLHIKINLIRYDILKKQKPSGQYFGTTAGVVEKNNRTFEDREEIYVFIWGSIRCQRSLWMSKHSRVVTFNMIHRLGWSSILNVACFVPFALYFLIGVPRWTTCPFHFQLFPFFYQIIFYNQH